jgi:hypothetical protein
VQLDGEPLPVHEGGWLVGTRTLDMRRGALLAAFTHRTPAGITVTEQELRLLSLSDRATGLQLQRFSVDRDGVEVRVEAIFGLAGLGMEPLQLEEDLGAWRTEGTRKIRSDGGCRHAPARRKAAHARASVPAALGVGVALDCE